MADKKNSNLDDLAASLHDSHLLARQRIALATQINTVNGNRNLQRVIAARQSAPTRTPFQSSGAASSTGVIQRQLIVSGSEADFDGFRALVEPAIGVQLGRDPITNRVEPIGSLATPATSPRLETLLNTIMSDTAQDAELQLGRAQPLVAGGAFPQPTDLTGGRVQTIDIDDMEAIEAGAPGHGVAALAHEINENYTAHSFPVVAGTNRFPASHVEGNVAQSDVAEDLVGPGRRVAERGAPGASANTRQIVFDFENYYLFLELTHDPTTNDFRVSDSRQVDRIPVSTYTIDSFGVGQDAVPAGGAASIASAAADLAGNPLATARIEGFADATGTAGVNGPLSQRRANSARAAIIAAGAGVGPGSIHTVGVGADRFVAPNDTDANRARNRRVVIMIDRPDI